MVRKQFKEEDGWETIPGMDDFWTYELIGDTVQGVYIEHESDVGVNHSEVYTLQQENEEDPETPIIHKIFGTTDLNNKFEQIKIGDEVGITFEGSKPSKPPKKPFKMFTVKKRTLANEEDADTSMGDPVAVKCIDEITTNLIDEGMQPTQHLIEQKAKEYHLAREEGYTDPKILGRIERQLNFKG